MQNAYMTALNTFLSLGWQLRVYRRNEECYMTAFEQFSFVKTATASIVNKLLIKQYKYVIGSSIDLRVDDLFVICKKVGNALRIDCSFPFYL